MRAHQELVDAQLDFAADPQRRTEQRIERVIDRAFRRVLDRHDAEIGVPGFDFMEHFIDRRQRERAHRMAEVLERGGLREGAFGTEVSRP